MTTDFSPIKRWYTGKALKIVVEYVLPTLAVAEEQGYWPKGASRKVWAALNKQAVAQKFAKANDRDRNVRQPEHDDSKLEGLLDDIGDDRKHYFNREISGAPIVHAMMFGQVAHAPKLVDLILELKARRCVRPSEQAPLQTAMQWALDFKPVAELLAKLDASRPGVVVVLGSLSRTVVANLGKSMHIALDRIESPQIEWSWATRIDPKTKKEIRIQVGKILWPENTLHCQSKFTGGSKVGNSQCHACGHAIRDPWNWVPLLAYAHVPPLASAPLQPVSLWVGRDCARKLFNVDVTGDAEYSPFIEGTP